MSRPVETAWVIYRAKVIPPCLSEDAVERLKEAFYAGYYEAMVMVQQVGDAQTTAVGRLKMDQVAIDAVNELTAFRLSRGNQRN